MLEVLKGLAEYRDIAMIELIQGCSPGTLAVGDCALAMGANGMRDDVPLGRHLTCPKLACYIDDSTEIMNDRIGASLVETYS